jgi:quercetin dioxygenase-like cupin family protein
VPATRLDPAVLADIAAGLACAEPLWRAVVRHEAGERRPVRLLATEDYEVWVIGWSPGQDLDLHDHGESAGVVAVVEGELRERSVVDGRLVHDELRPGRLRWLPPGLVHGVTGADDGPATSIHVYSPPLSRMTRFGDALAPLGLDLVEPEPPVLPAAAAGSLLHPSAARSSVRA